MLNLLVKGIMMNGLVENPHEDIHTFLILKCEEFDALHDFKSYKIGSENLQFFELIFNAHQCQASA